MNFLKTKQANFYFLYLILTLVLSHNIFHIDESNYVILGILILFLLYSLYDNNIEFPKIELNFKWKELNFQSLLISSLIILPSIIFLSKVTNNDFNFGGDQRDNVLWGLANTEFWISEFSSERGKFNSILDKSIFKIFFTSRLFILLIILSICLIFFKLKKGGIGIIFLFISFYVWSLNESIWSNQNLIRSQGVYFFSLFSNFLFFFLNLDLMDSLRYTNFFSIIVWLFILRPIFINKFPDLKILPFSILVLWHPDILFIINGSHGEPWSLILFFICIELIILEKKNAIPLSMLLIGIGSCFKPIISIFLPLLLLYSRPWKLDLKNKKKYIFSFLLAFFTSYIFPFYRSLHNFYSPVKLQSYGFSHLDTKFFQTLIDRIDPYLLIYFFAFNLCIVLYFWIIIKIKKNWLIFFLLASFALSFSFFFFNNHEKMIPHIFYSRYYMWAWVSLFSITILFTNLFSKKASLILSVFIILVYFPSILKIYEIDKNKLYKINNSIYWSDPIYLGLKPLINKSKKELDKRKITTLMFSRSTRIIHKIPSYLFKDKKIIASNRKEIICKCSNQNRAIINFYPKKSNLIKNYNSSRSLANPEGWGELFNQDKDKKKVCILEMKNSCDKTFLEMDDKTIIAILGIK